MNIEFGNRLASLRKEKGLSQEELADKLGVSRQAISKWENGDSAPDTDNLIALADIYDISLDELLGKRKEKKETVEEVEAEVVNPDEKISEDEDSSDFDDDDDDGDDDRHPTRLRFIKGIITSVGFFIALIAYLLLGFLWKGPTGGLGWAVGWTLLLLPAIVASLISAIEKRRPSHFAIALLVVVAYCGGGIIGNAYGLNLWHPYWVEFLLIPIYHMLCGSIEHAIHRR